MPETATNKHYRQRIHELEILTINLQKKVIFLNEQLAEVRETKINGSEFLKITYREVS